MSVRLAYVGVGSNCSSSNRIELGLKALKAEFGPLALSRVYRSLPKEGCGPKYINLVVGFRTDYCWSLVRRALKAIEKKAGRFHERKTVALDLDLLVVINQEQNVEKVGISLDDLKVEPYVLFPLSELLPDCRHPESNETFKELWSSVKNPLPRLEIAADVRDSLDQLISKKKRS